MNRILHLLQHIAFVAFAVLFVNLLIFDYAPSYTVKNEEDINFIRQSDVGKCFKESGLFNKMFGMSVSDAIDYCGLLDHMNSPEYQEVISGNSLINNDSGDDPYIKNISKYNDLFRADNSNIRFYAIERYSDTVSRQTNLNTSSMKDEDLKKLLLNECDKYIYIDAASHVYETNTLIEEETVYTLFRQSSYSFPVDTIFMAGVKKDLNDVDDYYSARNAFSAYTDGYYFKVAGLFASAIIYVFLLIVLTVREGHERVSKDTGSAVKTYPTDRIPFEIRFILLFVFFLPVYLLPCTSYGTELLDNLYELYIRNPLYSITIIGTIALIYSLIIAFFYYGFIRRVKAHIWWNTTITCYLLDKIKDLFRELTANMPIVLKSVLPFVLFVIPNVLIGYFGIRRFRRECDGLSIILLLALLALDVYVGYILYRNLKERKSIVSVIDKICEGNITAKADPGSVHGENIDFANAVNRIGRSINDAVSTSMKDEKMKTDLITNVSHDLKTPLTSIINYVDLLKKENINNENAVEYINILDEKSQRLKQLTDDLVEASKISSGNIVLKFEKISVKALIDQMYAEFYDKFESRNLTAVTNAPDKDIFINADSRSIFRVMENLMTNINKYALEGTRVYTDISSVNGKVSICLKNISANPLNITPSELMERFVRGDESRTTEGSGLGLSIAKNLTEAMGGTFAIDLDGDLFKVSVIFDEAV